MCESLMMQSAKAKNYLISHKLRPKQGWDTVKYNSSLQKDSLKNKLNKLKVWIKKKFAFHTKKTPLFRLYRILNVTLQPDQIKVNGSTNKNQ
uniref:Uncharacterized protein n=1 Tax=Anguilla anguilla TaxID=7936 RepID=A0A0E9X7X2_ANGAN